LNHGAFPILRAKSWRHCLPAAPRSQDYSWPTDISVCDEGRLARDAMPRRALTFPPKKKPPESSNDSFMQLFEMQPQIFAHRPDMASDPPGRDPHARQRPLCRRGFADVTLPTIGPAADFISRGDIFRRQDDDPNCSSPSCLATPRRLMIEDCLRSCRRRPHRCNPARAGRRPRCAAPRPRPRRSTARFHDPASIRIGTSDPGSRIAISIICEIRQPRSALHCHRDEGHLYWDCISRSRCDQPSPLQRALTKLSGRIVRSQRRSPDHLSHRRGVRCKR